MALCPVLLGVSVGMPVILGEVEVGGKGGGSGSTQPMSSPVEPRIPVSLVNVLQNRAMRRYERGSHKHCNTSIGCTCLISRARGGKCHTYRGYRTGRSG